MGMNYDLCNKAMPKQKSTSYFDWLHIHLFYPGLFTSFQKFIVSEEIRVIVKFFSICNFNIVTVTAHRISSFVLYLTLLI